MGWGRIGWLCGLKAIVLACFLTPTTAFVHSTPAYAQFNIVIPGFGFGYRGRRYGHRSYRHSRRGRSRDRDSSEIRPVTGSGVPKATEGGGGGGKKVRGTAD
jgi:hypothetical protein